MQQSKVIFETYWVGIIGLIWYLAALSLVALVVTVVFSVFVVPSFSSLFTQFAAPMPNLTTAVFAISGSGVPVLAIALALILGLVVWFVVIFHRRIQQFTPLPRWPSWAPIVGKITESYNLGLFLNFTRMLRECNVEPARAVAVAASESNQPESLSYESMANNEGDFAEFSVLTELSVAARLGHFDSELAYQCDQHIGRMSVSLVEARDRFSLILKLALYLFVSTLVVAMYLPIFKIGAVI